jgi:hypothetical protein
MLRFFLVFIFLCFVQFQVCDQTNCEPKFATTTKVFEKHETLSISLTKFLNKLAWLESGNNITTVSATGYLGKYQTKLSTIKALGFDVTQEEYLSRESLQDSVELALLRYNKRILNRYIKQYEGQIVDSVYITKAGILAGSHLVGAGGVISFFTNDSANATSDGNGVSVKRYLRLFSQYHLKEI